MRLRLPPVLRRRSVVIGLQIAFVVGFTAVLTWFLRDTWRESLPLLRDADPVDVGIALAVLAAYYLMFVLGWQWILAGLGIRIGYPLALQAEMASMLAKYVPGTVWTPLARILWLRRADVRATDVVFGSIAFEAGLSAISGVLVFALGLAIIGESSTTLLPLTAFARRRGMLLHPRVFQSLSGRAFRRLGWTPLPVLSYRTMLGLLVFYSVSWLVGGVAILFLARSLGSDPGWSSVPYLGGTAAVGAIVAVLSVFAPSGLGVREGSMFGLLLAVVPDAGRARRHRPEPARDHDRRGAPPRRRSRHLVGGAGHARGGGALRARARPSRRSGHVLGRGRRRSDLGLAHRLGPALPSPPRRTRG